MCMCMCIPGCREVGMEIGPQRKPGVPPPSSKKAPLATTIPGIPYNSVCWVNESGELNWVF